MPGLYALPKWSASQFSHIVNSPRWVCGAAATALLLNLLAQRQIHTDCDARRFEASLTTLAQRAIDTHGAADTWTDLAPIGLLHRAAQAAGLAKSATPACPRKARQSRNPLVSLPASARMGRGFRSSLLSPDLGGTSMSDLLSIGSLQP